MGEIINADAIHINKQTKIDVARILQKSGNELEGAKAELSRFGQSLSNRRKMDAGGSRANAITANIGRNLDAATSGNLQVRVQAAEELGALASQAAAANIGGSSLDQFNSTLRLNQAMREEQAARGLNTDNLNASEAKGEAINGAVSSLDNTVYSANLNFTEYVDHKKMPLFTRLATLATAAAATYFGGPEAGKAVIGLSEANQHARNGDLARADQKVAGAMRSAGKGIDTYRAQESGQNWGDGAWASVEKTAKEIGAKLKI